MNGITTMCFNFNLSRFFLNKGQRRKNSVTQFNDDPEIQKSNKNFQLVIDNEHRKSYL